MLETHPIIGAYGPKIFGSNENSISQFERIEEQLSKRKETKQAFLVISEINDYKVREEKNASPPCTIGLHFICRDGSLHLTAYMRSNDAYYGLPHDLFCFTMLQEIMAKRTNLNIGKYSHVCTSMHVYKDKLSRIEDYLKEGLHEKIEMPWMKSCSFADMKIVSECFNDKIPEGEVELSNLDDYWHDYTLFSNRRIKKPTEQGWLNKFRNIDMKKIAQCSITK